MVYHPLNPFFHQDFSDGGGDEEGDAEGAHVASYGPEDAGVSGYDAGDGLGVSGLGGEGRGNGRSCCLDRGIE